MRKKIKRGKGGLLNSRNRWVVFTAAAVCVLAIIIANIFGSGGNFQPISYTPKDGNQVVGPETGQESPDERVGEGEHTSNDGLKPGPSEFPDAAGITIPPHLSNEEKLYLIEIKYRNKYNYLGQAYQAEVDRLIESAKLDYVAVKSGKKDLSISRLTYEYYNAGRDLEKDADRRFNLVLQEMKNELKANGLPMSLAGEAEREYKDQKNALRKDMMQQVARYVND